MSHRNICVEIVTYTVKLAINLSVQIIDETFVS